jgi:hypothetical protein
MVADPDPDVVPTVAHDAAELAVHAQPVGVVIATLAVPACAPTVTLVGLTVTPHAAAACDTLSVCPPRLIDPAREVPLGFAAIVNVADPFPVPLEVPSVIHDVLVVAVHAHPDVAVTVTVLVPEAVAGSANEPGDRV